jgi:spoIIIJ-associated protein
LAVKVVARQELTVEATGETVGEAKWKALRDLERLAPTLDKSAVRFQVVSEGERGLLGVGYEPARVLASVSAEPTEAAPAVDESELAARLRSILDHVTVAMGIRCRIEVAETADSLTATCTGGDLGLLIGKHGQTIDAVQVLATAILTGGAEERKEVIVDAEGYRDRRRRTIEALAVSCAEQAVRQGARVELEAMSAAERKLVHERLKDYEGVSTVSEGDEPHRYVVVDVA